jgi:SAM-dependent methyltransferase
MTSEDNKAWFSGDVARNYDSSDKRATAAKISREILKFRNGHNEVHNPIWDPDHTVVLEYGCGTGLVSQGLAPASNRIIGLDVSPDMVAIFNEKVYNQGLGQEDMFAYVFDLQAETPESFQSVNLIEQFDAVVVSMAYHHIQDIDIVTKRLVQTLKPNGWLLIADFLINHDHGSMTREAAAERGVAHVHGIPDQQILECFSRSGLVDVQVGQTFRAKFWTDETRFAHGSERSEMKVMNGKAMHSIPLRISIFGGRKAEV